MRAGLLLDCNAFPERLRTVLQKGHGTVRTGSVHTVLVILNGLQLSRAVGSRAPVEAPRNPDGSAARVPWVPIPRLRGRCLHVLR